MIAMTVQNSAHDIAKTPDIAEVSISGSSRSTRSAMATAVAATIAATKAEIATQDRVMSEASRGVARSVSVTLRP